MNKFDRSFTYDFAGRMISAKSGIEAHGGTETDLTKLPYRQTYTHNAFGNLTERVSTLWNYTQGSWDFAYVMQNNRDTGSPYDADGRQTADYSQNEYIYFHHDAAGRMEKTTRDTKYETMMYQDGVGAEAKRRQRTWDTDTSNWKPWESVYFINSTVLGRVITETATAPESTQTGKKKYTYVVAGGTTIARQELSATNVEGVGWQFTDAAGLSSFGFDMAERDGLGNNVGKFPFPGNSRTENSMTAGQSQTFNNMGMGDCSYNGTFMPCSMVQMFNDGPGGLGDFSNNGSFFSNYANTRGLPHQANGGMFKGSTSRSMLGNELTSGGSYRQVELDDLWDPQTATVYNGGYALEYVGGANFSGNISIGGRNENLSNFFQAVSAVRDVLGTNGGENPCAAFFGGLGSSALNAISNAVTRAGSAAFGDLGPDTAATGIRMSIQALYSPLATPPRDLDTNVGVASLSSITINSRGPFFRASAPRIANVPSATLESRVVQLLHEMGHLVFRSTVPSQPIVGVNGRKTAYRRIVPILAFDGRNFELSRENTMTMMNACRDAVRTGLR